MCTSLSTLCLTSLLQILLYSVTNLPQLLKGKKKKEAILRNVGKVIF